MPLTAAPNGPFSIFVFDRGSPLVEVAGLCLLQSSLERMKVLDFDEE